MYPFSDQTGAKNLLDGAAHTYMAYIQELVVQKLHASLEVSRKAQKYTRVGPCKFVQYDVEELNIKGIIIINVQTMGLNLRSSKMHSLPNLTW